MSVVDDAELIRLTVSEELDKARGMLERAGLTWSEPELELIEGSVGGYTAELRIEFSIGEDIVDVFEFFVCRDGRPTLSVEEARLWIQSNVPGVVTRARAHR